MQSDDTSGYEQTTLRMKDLASKQPGYLGLESARNELGVTVSYWATADNARAWKRMAEHLEAQRLGRQRWYAAYRVRVARVEREYGHGTA